MRAFQSRRRVHQFQNQIAIQIDAIRTEYERLVRDAMEEYKNRESKLTTRLDTTLTGEMTATGSVMSQLNRVMSSNQPVGAKVCLDSR